jgi:hypothetical protein
MPRIIVTTDPSHLPGDSAVLLDEHVHSVHLSSGHAAAQLVERLAWAISDAEVAERARPELSSRPPARLSRRRAARPRASLQVGA